MAHYKRKKCKYQSSPHTSEVSNRNRVGLKPAKLPPNWWNGRDMEDNFGFDFGDLARGLKYNQGHPKWHDVLYHNKPRRQRIKRMLDLVKLDKRDCEDLAWELEKKPHTYYW